MTKPTVFISYSHKDEEWKDRLVTHLGVLQSQGLLDLWDDCRIGAGEDWEQEIQEAISAASVAVLLVSADFLTSQFILGEEVPRLLERRDKEGLRIFPVIATPCAWKEVKWLARMQVCPKDSESLSAGDEHQINTDLTTIAEEIAAIIHRPIDPKTQVRIDDWGTVRWAPWWWFMPGFLVTAILIVVLFTPFRCVLEYRVSEAVVALISLLIGAIAAILVKVAPPTILRGSSSAVVGIAIVLLIGVLVHTTLPSPSEEDCTPAPTPVMTLNIKLDNEVVKGEQTLIGDVTFIRVKAEILSDGTPVPPGGFEYKWSFRPSDTQNKDKDWSKVNAIDYYPPQGLQYQVLTIQVRGSGRRWDRSIHFTTKE